MYLKNLKTLSLCLSLLVMGHAHSTTTAIDPSIDGEFKVLTLKRKEISKLASTRIMNKRLSSQSIQQLCFEQAQTESTSPRCGLFHLKKLKGIGAGATYQADNLHHEGRLFTTEEMDKIFNQAPSHIRYKKRPSMLGMILLGVLLPPILIPLALYALIESASVDSYNRHASKTAERLKRFQASNGTQKMAFSGKKFSIALSALTSSVQAGQN